MCLFAITIIYVIDYCNSEIFSQLLDFLDFCSFQDFLLFFRFQDCVKYLIDCHADFVKSARNDKVFPPPLRILYPTLNPSRKGRDFFDSPSLSTRGLGGGFFARICIFIIASFCYDFAKSCKNLTHGNPHLFRHCRQFDFTLSLRALQCNAWQSIKTKKHLSY